MSKLSFLFLFFALFSCQDPSERRVSLTQEQWKIVRTHILEKTPTPEFPIHASFGLHQQPWIQLIGFDLEPNVPIIGQPLHITWYWKALQPMHKDWKVFVHVQPPHHKRFQNLDHHPVDGIYRTHLWKKDQIIVDRQEAVLKPHFGFNGAWIDLGFFDPQSGQRLDVIHPGQAQKSQEQGKLRAAWIHTSADQNLDASWTSLPPVIDGFLNDPAWHQTPWSKPFGGPIKGEKRSRSAKVKALYSKDYLFFAFDIQDSDLQVHFKNHDEHLWEQDCIELYLNPDNDDGTYWEVQVSPVEGKNPPVFDAYFVSHKSPHYSKAKLRDIQGLKAAVHIKPRQGYEVEIAIPLQSLLLQIPQSIDPSSVNPSQLNVWKVNFFNGDLKKNARKPKFLAWSPVGRKGDFHALDHFGTLTFKAPSKALKPIRKKHALHIFITGKHRRIKNLPQAFYKNRSKLFEHCLQIPFESRASKVKASFKLLVDELGNVIQVSRPSPAFISEEVTSCIVDTLMNWSIDMAPNAPPSSSPPSVTLLFEY